MPTDLSQFETEKAMQGKVLAEKVFIDEDQQGIFREADGNLPSTRPLEVTLKVRTLADANKSFESKLSLSVVELKHGMYCFKGVWEGYPVTGEYPAQGSRGFFKQSRKHMLVSVPVKKFVIPSGQLKTFSKALETMRDGKPYQMTLDVWSSASDQHFPIEVVLSELMLKGGDLYRFKGEWEGQPVAGELWATRRGSGTIKSAV